MLNIKILLSQLLVGFILTTFVGDADTASLAGTNNKARARTENRMATAAEIEALQESAKRRVVVESAKRRRRRKSLGRRAAFLSTSGSFTLSSGGGNGGNDGR